MTHAQIVSAAAVLQGTSVDMAHLSHIAQLIICILQRKPLIKGSIVYPLSFTGRMVVQVIYDVITQYVQTSAEFGAVLPDAHAEYMAMCIARSMKTQLFIHEADWEDHALSAGVDEVYMFFSDSANNEKLDVPSVQASKIEGDLFVRQAPNAVSLSAPAAVACVGSAMQDMPTGVFAPLTRCYSPTCALSSPPHAKCYVPSCPRMGRAWKASDLSVADALHDVDAGGVGAKAWVETVPQELVASLPRAHVERQNAIHEMIQKEESFLHDLQLLDRFVARLRSLATSSGVGMAYSAPLSGEELEVFVQTVFGNYQELMQQIEAFVDRLRERQREEQPMVETIGDLVVNAALEWGPAYTKYLEHYPIALHTLKTEITKNARMAKFADDCRRDPAAHRHPLDNFLFRPPARLQRYHLHLASIAKYTDAASPDKEHLLLATEIIDEQCRAAQRGVEAAEQRLEVEKLEAYLEPKRPEHVFDLDLRNPQRKLLHHGIVFRRPDGFEFEWTEMEAILFDHYFVLAKRKRPTDVSGSEAKKSPPIRLVYSKKVRASLLTQPIPVALLTSSGFDEPPLSRGHLNRRLMPGDTTDMFPFTIHPRSHDPIVLYVPTANERSEWQQQFSSLTVHLQEQEAQHTLFARTSLCAEPFTSTPGGMLVDVTCATTFFLPDRTKMIAVGTSDGVWIGLHGQRHSFHKVLHLRGVTQCAMLERFGHFLVLAEHTLIAYDIQALVPSHGTPPSFAPQKLSGNRDVLFFACGIVDDRQLLVYGKKKTNETSIRVLEPVDALPIQPDALQSPWHRRPSETFSRFREYQKFYVGYEAMGVQFLRHSVAVFTHRGFQTYALDTKSLEPLPSMASREDVHNWTLLRHLEHARPLGLFHLPNTQMLLCYDRMACYTDASGRLVRSDAAFQWEGRPARVAYHAPYVLAFSASFVEIWDALAGRLQQILPGSDIHLLSKQDGACGQPPDLLLTEQIQNVYELYRTKIP